MSLLARLRRRRELARQLRFANPRQLSRSDYVAELRRQEAALSEVRRLELMPPPPPPWEVMEARGRALRDAYHGAPLTRDEQAAWMNAQAIAEAASR